MPRFASFVSLPLPLVAALFASPAELSASGDRMTPTMEAVPASELPSILHGAFLTPVFPEEMTSSDRGVERFESNGTYVRYYDRVRASGTFVIVGDAFCVRLPQREPPCRRLFRDQAGRLFTASPDLFSAPFVRVEITPAAD